MTKTYTLVLATSDGGVTVLIGSPRDGDTAGIDAAIAGHREMEREYRSNYDLDDPRRDTVGTAAIELISSCILTNDEPEDENRILWSGHECGWLIDENGETFEFATR